jgi:hypothetical protein
MRETQQAGLGLLGVVLLLALLPCLCRAASEADIDLLMAFKETFENGDTVLASWNGTDPCVGKGDQWRGVSCMESSIFAM